MENRRVYVAGHTGLIGNYLCESLKERGCNNLIVASSQELDLRNKQDVDRFFESEKPEYVFMIAAVKAGVEEYWKEPVKYFADNMQMEMNVLSAAYKNGTKKVVFSGASCVYPESKDLVVEESFFPGGWVQKATEPYALAKAAGLKLAEYYNMQYGTSCVTALLSNIYGVTDEIHMDTTSVIPGLMQRFKDAVKNHSEEVVIWGDGSNKREFLHAKDSAEALVKIMESKINRGWINVGSGEMVSINDLAILIADTVGYKGNIVHDLTKPNGSQRSVLDITKLKKLGWHPTVTLKEGIQELAETAF